MGAGALMVRSDDDDAAGRSAGVVPEERVREDDVGRDGWLGLTDRDGLISCRLFFRDLDPAATDPDPAGVVNEARVFVLEWVLTGDCSRDASGEGAPDDGADVLLDGCDANLDGHESVLGVIVVVLADVESRESEGYDGGYGVC